jgi:murein DD-endopeptidase MepM/ murein hydrolase activator NlpD
MKLDMIKLYAIAILIIVLGIIAYLFSPINTKLHFPLANKTAKDITSFYGYRKHPITGKEEFHNGIDIKASEGDYIYAVYDGIVRVVGYDERSGNKIVIQHPGFYSHYAHLKDIFVKENQKVKKGDIIGTVGATGLTTAPHLHFALSKLGLTENVRFFLNPLKDVEYENFA